MKKVCKYLVISDLSFDNFIKCSNDAISDGWHPPGGIEISKDEDGEEWLYQAFVQFEETTYCKFNFGYTFTLPMDYEKK